MRLILLSDFHPSNKLGGGGAIAYEFHEIALNSGHQSNFWYAGEKNTTGNHEREFAVSDSRFQINKLIRQVLGSFASLRIVVAIQRKRPDIVWIHQIGNRISYSVILALRLFGVPTVVTLHDYLVICQTKVGVLDQRHSETSERDNLIIGNRLHEVIRRLFLRAYVNRANKVFTVSELQQEILSNFGIKSKLSIPNGVPECKHADKRSTLVGEQYNALFAGRLHRKGLEYLIEGIKASPNNWVLHLAGDEDLLLHAQSQLPSEKINFHGRVSRHDLHKLMHDMQLVSVLSQYFDPYPTVGLEALRHGSMFITTNTTGISVLARALDSRLVLNVGEIPNLDSLLNIIRDNDGKSDQIRMRIPSQEKVFKQYFSQLAELLL